MLKPGQRASMDDEERVGRCMLTAAFPILHLRVPTRAGAMTTVQAECNASGEVSIPHHTCHKK